MNINGHEEPSQSLPDASCASCGLPANPRSDHVVVEFNTSWSQDTVCRIWHRRCYDEFLDFGEEV